MAQTFFEVVTHHVLETFRIEHRVTYKEQKNSIQM